MLSNLIHDIKKEELLKSMYNNYYREINGLIKNIPNSEVKKSFKHFDIRFRLALDITVKFDKKVSKIKSKKVQNIYELLIKLTDFWFAYEGLAKIIKTEGLNDKNKQNFDLFTDISIKKISINTELIKINDELKKKLKNPIVNNELSKYLLFLKENSQKKLSDHIGKCINKIKNEILFEHSDIMSVIYAIRNMHVHNIDTTKTGFDSYFPKTVLLRLIIFYLIITTFKTAMYLINVKKFQ